MTPRVLAGTLAAAAAVAAALVAASLLTARDTAAPAPAAAPAGPSAIAGIPQDGLVLGDQAAPLTLVEYADVQCPFCALWAHDQMPGIVDAYVRTGRARLVFHGLAFIGPESDLALRAVLAAGLQDRLWSLLEVLYANQGHENAGWVTEGSLRSFGARVDGLDVERMLADLRAPEVERELLNAARAAEAAGVQGTPSFQLGPTGGSLALVAPGDLPAALAG